MGRGAGRGAGAAVQALLRPLLLVLPACHQPGKLGVVEVVGLLLLLATCQHAQPHCGAQHCLPRQQATRLYSPPCCHVLPCLPVGLAGGCGAQHLDLVNVASSVPRPCIHCRQVAQAETRACPAICTRQTCLLDDKSLIIRSTSTLVPPSLAPRRRVGASSSSCASLDGAPLPALARPATRRAPAKPCRHFRDSG